MPVLPVSEAFAFRAPVVNGGKLVLPVLVTSNAGAKLHGIRASFELWRQAAQEILSACAPDKHAGRPRKLTPIPMRDAPLHGAISLLVALGLVVLGALGVLGAKHYSDSRAPAKLEAKQQAVTDAQAPVLKGVQENIHKAQFSIAQVPDSRAKQVTSAFLFNASAGIDQAVGSPNAADITVWQDLVNRLLSDNAAIRAKADSDNAASEEKLNAASTKLAAAAADRDDYQRKFNVQAAEAIELQAKVRKYLWIAGALAALWFVGQVLAKAAQSKPIFAGASAFVNSVVAPGVHSAFTDAKQTIEGVGKAIGIMKTTLAPDAAAALDANIAAAVPNQSHVTKISNAASVISALTPTTTKTS